MGSPADVWNSIQGLFEKLPEQLKKNRARPMPSKKRSAPAPNVSLIPSRINPSSNRRSDEITRPQSSQHARDQPPILPHRASFDVALQQNGIAGQGFSANLQELLPLDMAAVTHGEAGGTPAPLPRRQSYRQTPTPGSANPLYKLDAMMFPSADPFAYPNQPLMDFGSQQQVRPPQRAGSQHQDTMHFYSPTLYDDIEGQLLGPIPPYLVPQPGQSPQGGNLPPQLFNSANILALQQAHASQQPHLTHHHQQQQQQQQQREIDEILNDPSFRGDWGDLLGTSSYRQL